MARTIRLGGHPLHPAIVHFPIALWTVAVGADLAGWLTGQPDWWFFGKACLGLGVVAGLFAMVAGALDYAALPRRHPAQDTAARHMLWMITAWLLFTVSLVARGYGRPGPPPRWAIVAALVGFAIMAIGGWLGGRLVYRHAVGVSASSIVGGEDRLAASDDQRCP